jgi:hypothetical protein
LSLKILHENCNPELANDRSLPYTTYLVTYEIDGAIAYDLVMTEKRVDIFDHYWDKYREGLKKFKQTEGRRNPKLWDINPPQKKKGKKQ